MGKIERAIISVTDKSGIVEFANSLSGLGMQILSTGGTARADFSDRYFRLYRVS